MSRSRNLLHKNRLLPFKAWLEEHEWVSLKPDSYQVLKMEHPIHTTLIIYSTIKPKEHLSVEGIAYTFAKRFVEETRNEFSRRSRRKASCKRRLASLQVG